MPLAGMYISKIYAYAYAYDPGIPPKKSNMLPSLPEWKTLYPDGRMGDMWDSENDDVSKPTKEKKYLQRDYALYMYYTIYNTLV